MNQKILFSPVGGTDPISENNCHDGSLLHICRVYRPDRIILYMSREILDKQEQDDRYRYAIRKLYESLGCDIPEILEIERKELNNVHEYDYFYDDFHGILSDINSTKDETDELLINVSSGTPAMKSGLLVLETLIQSMGESSSVKMIQVATPDRAMNEHTHSREYDNEVMWELNDDNRPDFVNRCREVSSPTLLKLRNEEIIKEQIASYDYRAALDIARTMPMYSASYVGLLQMADYRLLLDFSNVDKLISSEGYNCLPIKTSGERIVFEYALNMDIKLQRKEYSDYILRITPLVFSLFELILKKQANIRLSDYTTERNKGEIRWDTKKLDKTDVLDKLNSYFNMQGGFVTTGFVSSEALNALIQSYCDDSKLKALTNDVRDIERNVRNIAAHQMASITPDVIQARTGFSADQIMTKIKALFNYTAIKVTKDDWKSYGKLNEEIIRRMSVKD